MPPVRGVRAVPALFVVAALVLVSVFGVTANPVQTAAAVQQVTPSPDPLEMGPVVVGEWSSEQLVRLGQTWSTGVQLEQVTASGPDVRVGSHDCDGGWISDPPCFLPVQVKPETAGPGNGWVRLTFHDTDGSERYARQVDVHWTGVEMAPPTVNHLPVGGVTLSLTDGRGYGALVWAVDPDGGLPTKVRMHIPSVVTRETFWNYYWADMPRYTGVNRHEAMVFLAQLPPGSHDVCFDALDNQSGQWTRIGCRNHVVK